MSTQYTIAGTYQQDSANDFIQFLNQTGSVVWSVSANGGVIQSAILASAAQPTFRGADSEVTFPASSVAVTGSVAGVRGNTTIPASGTVTSGFVYGSQGKLTVKGSLTSANFSSGLLGQLDLSAATAISTGRIAAIWADAGATFSAGAISGQGVVDLALLTNTAAGSMINSVFHVEALATYLLDVSNATYSPFYHSGAPGTLSGSLKINTPDGARYIALYTTQ